MYHEDGSWTQEVDYTKALELFRRITTEYAKGETRYYDEAIQQIDAITKPSVQVAVPSVFLPDSEVEYDLAWRNASRVELALYKVDLPRDTALTTTKSDVTGWTNELDLSRRKPVASWFRDTNDGGDHRPGQAHVHYDQKLQTGAYLIEAKAGGVTSRDLLLITDTAVVVKSSARQALAYVCKSGDGAPVWGRRSR